jgi:hypothetical protein
MNRYTWPATVLLCVIVTAAAGLGAAAVFRPVAQIRTVTRVITRTVAAKPRTITRTVYRTKTITAPSAGLTCYVYVPTGAVSLTDAFGAGAGANVLQTTCTVTIEAPASSGGFTLTASDGDAESYIPASDIAG